MNRKQKLVLCLVITMLLFSAIPLAERNGTQEIVLEDNRTISAAPAVATNATCTNTDDSDNLYARYKSYIFTANVTDGDGDIDHVNLSLVVNGGSIQWTVKYDNTTDTFSEAAGATNIELVSGSSYANRTATAVDLTIAVKIEWVHSDIDNVILQTVVKDGSDTTTDNSTASLDVISSVAIVNSTISDARGSVSVSNLNITGTVVYCNSSSNLKPPSAEADVWITSSAGNVSDLTLSSGVFSNASVPASSTVGTNTYTMIVVPEGGGATGSDQTNSTYTKSYIGDKIKVTYLTADETSVVQGEEVLVYFNLIREYDDSNVQSGTVTLNGYTAHFLRDNQWYISVTKYSDTSVTFNSVSISSETYGITTVNMNSKTTTVTWSGTAGGGGGSDNDDIGSNNPFIDPDTGSVNSTGILVIVGAGGVALIGLLYMFYNKPK